MLTLGMILTNGIVLVLGIYRYDYLPDGRINQPLVILLSILAGLLGAFLFAILFMEITYYLFARRLPTTSKFKHMLGRQIVRVPLHLFRIKTTVFGIEHLPKDSGFLIYSNHTSELDISVLMCNLKDYPVAFLSKQAVMKYLSVGKWAVSIGCVMLDRDNNRQGSQAIQQVIHNVQHGSTMVIFPEGTLTREVGGLLKFRSGAFKVATQSGVPLVPVTIVKEQDYNNKRWPRSKRIDIVIHEPLSYESFQDLSSRQLGQQVREIIKNGLPHPIES